MIQIVNKTIKTTALYRLKLMMILTNSQSSIETRRARGVSPLCPLKKHSGQPSKWQTTNRNCHVNSTKVTLQERPKIT